MSATVLTLTLTAAGAGALAMVLPAAKRRLELSLRYGGSSINQLRGRVLDSGKLHQTSEFLLGPWHV